MQTGEARMSDYVLVSKALDNAHGAYERHVLESLMNRLRDEDAPRLSSGNRDFARVIAARAVTTI